MKPSLVLRFPGWFLFCPVWVLVQAGVPVERVTVLPRRAWLEPWLVLMEWLFALICLPRRLIQPSYEPTIPLLVRRREQGTRVGDQNQ